MNAIAVGAAAAADGLAVIGGVGSVKEAEF
jgi:hypothetical protein